MIDECRWMKVKVCDPPARTYLPPANQRWPGLSFLLLLHLVLLSLLSMSLTSAVTYSWLLHIIRRRRRGQQGHGRRSQGRPDPLGDLLRGVGRALEPVAKIVSHIGAKLANIVDSKVKT